MSNSDRDPDAIDRIREDALTEPQPQWPAPPDGMSATVNAKLQAQADRIRELETQLAETRQIISSMQSIIDDLAAADLLEAQKDAIGRERNEARGAEIQLAALRPKLADCETALAKANAALAAANAKDSEKTRDINLLTQENRQQTAQLATYKKMTELFSDKKESLAARWREVIQESTAVNDDELFKWVLAQIDALSCELAAATERERAAQKRAGRWAGNYLGLLIDLLEQPDNDWMLELLRPKLTQLAAALAASEKGGAK